jgi:hypothetical protein
MQLQADQLLYVRLYGKSFRVTAVFLKDDEANQYMREHPDEGVIAAWGPLILLAKMTDTGE